jgi:hypothetical protein
MNVRRVLDDLTWFAWYLVKNQFQVDKRNYLPKRSDETTFGESNIGGLSLYFDILFIIYLAFILELVVDFEV